MQIINKNSEIVAITEKIDAIYKEIKKKFYFHRSIPQSLSRKVSSKMLLSCIIGLKELSNIYSNKKIVSNEIL